MTYANPFLVDFLPVFLGILDAGKMNPARIEVIVIDEEPEDGNIFEKANTKDVLYQLGPELNSLTIYTNRFNYFAEFVKQMDEEYGLIVVLLSKKGKRMTGLMQSACDRGLVLDFEWKGQNKLNGIDARCAYVPIHKKPWKVAENLDILVPFSYNTVIVKSRYTKDKKFVNDRFDEGFYRDELFYKEG